MKSSKKMENTISKFEKIYGKLNRDYFIEPREENQVGNGYYDGCTLRSPSPSMHVHIVVAHDGTSYSL